MEINPFFSKLSACWCTSPILFLAKQMDLSVLLENGWSWSLLRNYLCGWVGCMSMGMVWVKCGALAPGSQFYAPLPLFCAALALGKLIYWRWSGVRLAHALLEGTSCADLLLLWLHFVPEALSSPLQEGASLGSWHVSLMKIVGLFLLFRGCSCQNCVQLSPVIFSVAHFRENASTGKGCQLGPGLFTPGKEQ